MIFNNKYNPHPNPTEKLKINNISIDLVSEFNFLGVTIDNELNWVAHTQKINSKTSRTLGILKKLKRIAPLSVLTTLYSTMILTNFPYGIKAWGFAHSKLSTIQKKTIRIITNSKFNAHTDPLFKKLKLLKIQDIFKLSCLTFHYKLERRDLNLTPAYFQDLLARNWDIHRYPTRNYNIRVMPTNYVKSRESIRHFLPELILSLPDHLLKMIFDVSIVTFKYHVKQFFINEYYAVCPERFCKVCGTDILF